MKSSVENNVRRVILAGQLHYGHVVAIDNVRLLYLFSAKSGGEGGYNLESTFPSK